jgi:methionyl-tRNA formyltransferase
MRIIFMGTPDFAVPSLQQCIDHFDVVAVYTQPDRPVGRGLELRPSPVKQLALQKAIPVFQPEKLTLPGEYEKLAALRPDVIVVVAYGQILKKNVLELPPLKCINLHSSVLPRWRGAAPIHHTILAGDSVAGVSTMYMAEKLDAGNVLMTDSFPLQGFETVTELHDRLSNLGAQLLIKTLNWIEKEKPQGTIQDESLVTYATKLEKSMEWLDPKVPR